MQRRHFLQLTVSAAAGLTQSMRAQQTTFRKSVIGMDANSPEIKLYAEAVRRMKALDSSKPADPRGWTAQARIHNGFCPHQNWWFLPWHRAYLFYFESVCRDILSDVAEGASFCLPYWDWSRSSEIPPTFLGDATNSLFNGTRIRNSASPDDVKLDTIKELVTTTALIDIFSGKTNTDDQRQPSQQGELEFGPHNSVHRDISGDMGTFMSPIDPIFWLHHCNIDRIWASWSRDPNHKAITDDLWRKHSLAQFYDPVAKREVSPVVATTTSEVAYRAIYDAYEEPIQAPHTLLTDLGSTTLFGSRKFSTSRVQRLAVDADMAKASKRDAAMLFSVDAQSVAKVLDKAAETTVNREEAAVYVYLTSVPTPESPSLALRLFINCENPSVATPLSDPRYAGTLSFFGGEHADHGSGTSFAVNITRVLPKIAASGAYSPGNDLAVGLVAVDARDPSLPVRSRITKPGAIKIVGLERK